MNRNGSQPGAGNPEKMKGQRGHLMAGLMAAVAIMLIFSTVAFQAWTDFLRRDNEAEMIFRAQDLVRAIQRYRQDHGGMGPLKMEDLLEAGPKGQYYARKLWTDPLVPDGKWGLLHVGPGGQIIDPSMQADPNSMGGLGGSFGSGSGLGGSSSGGLSGMGNSGSGQQMQTPMSGLGNSKGMGKGKGRGGLPNSSLNPNDPSQLEGLPIAGVKSLCTDKPFRVYNGLTEYNQWLFTYLDLELGAGPGGRQKQLNRDLPAGSVPSTRPRPGFGRGPGQGQQGQQGQPGQPGFPQPNFQQPGQKGPNRR